MCSSLFSYSQHSQGHEETGHEPRVANRETYVSGETEFSDNDVGERATRTVFLVEKPKSLENLSMRTARREYLG